MWCRASSAGVAFVPPYRQTASRGFSRGGQPVMLLQRNVNGSWAVADRMVVAGVDRPLAGLYNGQYLALVADRSGTVQAGVQPSGAADQLATYIDHGPFGEPQNAGGTINTGGDVQAGFTGAGGTPNGLGLVYLRNRWYDPGTGRFLTQDPIGLAGGLNLYAYAGNNPSSFSDPFGLKQCCLGGPLDAQMAQMVMLSYLSSKMDEINNVYHLGLAAITFALSGGAVLEAGAATEIATSASETEVVQRAMSKEELHSTEETQLLRGGRDGTHYVSDAVNTDASRARQRLALPQRPDVRVTMRMPADALSAPTRVPAKFNMPGGGTQRTATGAVPVQILKVDEYK